MNTRSRSGFSLVEVLIVAVLGALVVGATYQILITNQRTYTAQNAQIQSQQTVRAGMDVLSGELRELSRKGSDLLAIGSDTVRVRALRKFGLVCGVDLTNGTLDVRKVGNWFGVGDSVVVYAENKENSSTDDRWIKGRVSAVDTTIACGSAQASRLTITAVNTAATSGSPRDTVRSGSNLRSYSTYTYGLYTVAGSPYLARKDSANNIVPMVGPLKSSSGLAFRYLDSTSTETSTLANISQVEVTLRTSSSIRGPNGQTVADSIVTRVYTRN